MRLPARLPFASARAAIVRSQSRRLAIPGSLAYGYFEAPERGIARARQLDVRIDERALTAKAPKYREQDFIDPEEMIDDFIEIFCPEITRGLADTYLERIRDTVEAADLVYECGSL